MTGKPNVADAILEHIRRNSESIAAELQKGLPDGYEVTISVDSGSDNGSDRPDGGADRAHEG